MSTPEINEKELKFAKDLVAYLNCGPLPKTLIDDRKNLIDPESRSEDDLILAHFREDSLYAIKTVRFLKDFMRYKAVPDLSTTNTSFIRTAEIFRQQGIKNYYFHLQLNNPMLKGVDPFDPNLTNEQQLMIHEECRTNFWYFLREVCRLRPDRSFLANRGNISFIWAYLNHITTYMIMPRQQGKYQRNSNKVRVVGKGNTPKDRWKQIGDLRPGDEIIDRLGKPSTVIGIHPQGRKRLYRVECSDGRKTEAGTEHLWHIGDHSNTLNGEPVWDDYTTGALIAKMQQKVKLELPLLASEDGEKQEHLIDPYVMGCLLHGFVSGRGVGVHQVNETRNQFIRDHIPLGLEYVLRGDDFVIQKVGKEVLNVNFELGLPLQYLEGALEDRLSVLQAFLDTGEVTPQGIAVSSSSPVLRSQIQYLARSLGGTATEGKDQVKVTLPEDLSYFKFKEVDKLPKIKNQLFITKLVYAGDDECTCIEVDNEEHLYITDDFIVTHNTVSVQVINFWLTYIMGRGYKSHLITLKSDNRAQFIDAIKKIRTCMPKYMINPTWRDKDSGTYLNYKAFGDENVNTLNINVPQTGEDAAGDMGRGLTVGTTNYDEPGYIKYIEAIINGCAPSALTEMALCRAAGIPYGINFITTPNTTLHPSGEYMFKKLMSATEWREKFFDSYSESHLKQRLLRASPVSTTSPSLAMVYNYLQLGKDKDWVKETIDELGLTLSKAKIDLLLMWVEDGENRLFDDVTREAINNVKRDKVWSKEYRDSGLFVDFFVTQEELLNMGKKEYNDFFLIGCDTSSAINKDACTLIIRSLKTGKVIGVGRYPLAFLDDVTAIITDMLVVLENSLLVIERNYAHHMIDNLLIMLPTKGLDPFTKIFNQVYQDPINHAKELAEVQNTKFAYRNKNFYLKFKQFFGFNTTAKSRETLYGLIQEAVGVTGYGISYDKLADELINLRTKADRIDHDAKRHDDLVIAWLLTYWFIKLGMNKPFYGIPSGIALIDTRNLLEVGKTKDVKDMDPSIIQLVDKIREKVQRMTEELLNTTDNILAIRLEAEIHKLSKLLPPDSRKHLTIDDLLNEAKAERSRRMMRNKKAA